MRFTAWASAAALLLALPAPARAVTEPAPRESLEMDLGAAAWTRLLNGSAPAGRQAEANESAAWVERRPVTGAWNWAWGARQEVYQFRGSEGPGLARLQDESALLGLEYRRGGETAASLTVYPGFYFERRASWDSFDVPFDFTTAVPLEDPVNGVIGVSHGRLYRRPIPVFGATWAVRPEVTVNAVYPEPSVVARLSDRLEARVGGELLGAAFRADGRPGRPVVEHFLYRAGPSIEWELRRGLRFSGGAGWEFRRGFEFAPGFAFHGRGAPYAEAGLKLYR